MAYDNSNENFTLRINNNKYFTKAILLSLCISNDTINSRKLLDKYYNKSIQFSEYNEYDFLNKFIDAIDNKDFETFTTYVYEFDKYKKLDDNDVKLLLKIKIDLYNCMNIII